MKHIIPAVWLTFLATACSQTTEDMKFVGINELMLIR
jgi:hypothetical protein